MDEKKPSAPAEVNKPRSFVARALAFFGIEVSTESFFLFSLRPRLLYFILGFILLGLASLGGLTVYSTKPAFCNTCHIMAPYYNAWNTSSHNFVSCVDCHYPPAPAGTHIWHKFQALSQVVKYITRTYSSRPYAEIPDESCLRGGCHSTRLLQGRAVSSEGILFNHQPHLEHERYGQQLRCVSCHSQLVVGKHMEVTWDTCYLCHLKGHVGERGLEPMGGCQGCHFVPEKEIGVGNISIIHKDFISFGKVDCQACHRDAASGEGEVDKDRCYVCHNQPEKLARFGETDFIHYNHVTLHNTACFHCHREIRHGLTIRKDPKMLISECGKCHSSTHDLQGQLYAGTGALGVPEMPSPMFLARVDCVGCHLQREQLANALSHAATYTGSEIGCSNCHGDEYLGMVPGAQAMVDETVQKLSVKLTAVNQAMKQNPPAPDLAAKMREKLDETSHNLEFISSTRSAHNIYYASESLNYADVIISAAANRLGLKDAQNTSNLPIVSGGYCAALCHNRLGVEVPPKMVNFNGKEIPHYKHIDAGLSCRMCHTFGAHKEVKFKGQEVCTKCHSEDQLK
ncbi:MAG TPA: NapC/NirT family cytochrome c [bacterium]|nr:NapC/NirT family cytochrome c [bacterium]